MVDIHNTDSIRFNGQTSDKFVMQRTAAYVDQVSSINSYHAARQQMRFWFMLVQGLILVLVCVMCAP